MMISCQMVVQPAPDSTNVPSGSALNHWDDQTCPSAGGVPQISRPCCSSEDADGLFPPPAILSDVRWLASLACNIYLVLYTFTEILGRGS